MLTQIKESEIMSHGGIMGSAFKLNPSPVDKVEFKNGVGQVVSTVVKTDDNRLFFTSSCKYYALNEKEQIALVDFLLGNL